MNNYYKIKKSLMNNFIILMKENKKFPIMISFLMFLRINNLFFELKKNSPQCFLEEFLDGNVLLIYFLECFATIQTL